MRKSPSSSSGTTPKIDRRVVSKAGPTGPAFLAFLLDGFDGDQMCVHHINERFVIEQIQNPPVSLAASTCDGPSVKDCLSVAPNAIDHAIAGVIVTASTAQTGRRVVSWRAMKRPVSVNRSGARCSVRGLKAGS